MSSSRSTGILLAVTIIYIVNPVMAKGSLTIAYKRQTFNKAVGEDLRLTCNVTYIIQNCREIEAFWYKNNNREILVDEQRYVTTVSEKHSQSENSTERHVELEIKSLVLNDTGQYQCKAHCPETQAAVGHIISLFVKEADYTTMQGNGCRLIKAEALSTMLFCMMSAVLNLW